jgi:hypothetical protein
MRPYPPSLLGSSNHVKYYEVKRVHVGTLYFLRKLKEKGGFSVRKKAITFVFVSRCWGWVGYWVG